ncbi:MAG TPA: arginine deiminase family protein [Gemmatimonadaceae bacterium]|nr:arginine deiminase family protein [Gemmatimonadaceae bacterium]
MPPHTSSLLAVTRDISPAIAQCELTHLDRAPIDLARAKSEHDAYEATLRELGCEVRRLTAGPHMADSVFIEDTAIVLDELAVITRPGAESRRAETAAVAATLRTLRPVAAVLAPGTLDGGDVMLVGRALYVGIGYRTNEAGVGQLRSIVSSQGYTVDAVPFDGCLHLKSAVSIVADDLLLVNPQWVDARRFGDMRVIEIDPAEPFAANALRVHDSIVYSAEHVRTAARLEAAGLDVRRVPAGELAKAEGAVTCCSLILRA